MFLKTFEVVSINYFTTIVFILSKSSVAVVTDVENICHSGDSYILMGTTGEFSWFYILPTILFFFSGKDYYCSLKINVVIHAKLKYIFKFQKGFI